NLRITLKYEGKLHHIDSPFPNPFVANATPEQVASYQTLFAEEEKFALLNAYKMEDSQSVSSYVLKMKSYIDKLERLRHPVPHRCEKEVLEKGERKFQGKEESSTTPEERERNKGCRVLPLQKDRILEEELSLLPC
ncbi:hypothetical protein Tco_1027562, partial [Tanacetum coccineum]